VTRLTRWLPAVSLLHLDAWQRDNTATQLTWQVTSTQALVHCPVCRFPTRRGIGKKTGFRYRRTTPFPER
jgi:hypothetical protein